MKTILLIVLMTTLGGCASTTPQTKHALIELSVRVGAGKFFQNNPKHALRAVAILDTVRFVIGTDTVDSVAALEEYLRAQIHWENLTPDDVTLINGLLPIVFDELRARVGTGKLTSDKLVVVSEVLGWISDTAKQYTPH